MKRTYDAPTIQTLTADEIWFGLLVVKWWASSPTMTQTNIPVRLMDPLEVRR